MCRPKTLTPSIDLDTLLDSEYPIKEEFLKAFSLSGSEIDAARCVNISLLKLQSIKASDDAFSKCIEKLREELNEARVARENAISAISNDMRDTLRSQGIYSPLSEPYIHQYASILHDINQLELSRASSYYDPTAKNSLEPLIKARRSELSSVLKVLIPAIKPSKHISSVESNDPLTLLRR